MDRRDFLTLAPSRKKTSKPAAARTYSGLAPYTGEWGTAQVVHLLKRAMFGAAPADVKHFRAMSMDQAVDALIQNNTVTPAPPVNNYSQGAPDSTGVAPGATWVTAPEGDEDLNNDRRTSYKAWWTGVMLSQQRTIHEKLVLFWHNHWATETQTIGDARFMYLHNVTLRQYALGNFRAMAKAITLDPAMLVYLNGYLNEKTAADENYARELLELFTCGKGPASLYQEEDVRAGAHVLTGYKVDKINIRSYFDPSKHDITNKQFSPWFSNKVISGKTGEMGATELDDMLQIIFAQHEVAKFICRKFYQFFIYYEIDDATETNVIEPLAKIFRDANYEIKPLLLALFKCEHFYDPLNMSCLIKSPVDFTVGLCREFGVTVAPAADYANAYPQWQALQSAAGRQQQNIGDPPGVSGWEAYYLAPQFHELWINTDTLPQRNMFADQMIGNGYRGLRIDPIAFAEQLSDPSNPVLLVRDSLDILYRMGVSDTTKSFLKDNILLGGTEQDYYWTQAWNVYKADTSNAANKAVVVQHLRALYKYIMNLSEYHLA
ncbi:DUF1800 domain-containing protein [Chitinophaga lutea]|uniref:DUF1800 domain-containing protein n=1 Tax=Chitinophaga lutea TaxID=2488634 RepID=A0A3N4QA26_9BACT|nr:DUF1800 domain-containing protein [Chitinophaga lutea]RPE12877.1 DUF1800 domain-containing protein [Chitinophaga lutea]